MNGPKIGGYGATPNVVILGAVALIGDHDEDITYLILAFLQDQSEYVVSYVTEDAVKANGDVEWWVSGQYFVNEVRAWHLFTDRIMNDRTHGDWQEFNTAPANGRTIPLPEH